MDTTNELNQHEVINKMESAVQSEVLDEKELEKETIDTIVALVNQSKAISAENSPIENTTTYEDVDDPTVYIKKTEEYESKIMVEPIVVEGEFAIQVGTVFDKSDEIQWKCGNCGFIFKGSKAPERCPVCGYPKAYFEQRALNYK